MNITQLNMTAVIKRTSNTANAYGSQEYNPVTVVASAPFAIRDRQSSGAKQSPGLVITDAGIDSAHLKDGYTLSDGLLTFVGGYEAHILKGDMVYITHVNGVALSAAEAAREVFLVQDNLPQSRSAGWNNFDVRALVLQEPGPNT